VDTGDDLLKLGKLCVHLAYESAALEIVRAWKSGKADLRPWLDSPLTIVNAGSKKTPYD